MLHHTGRYWESAVNWRNGSGNIDRLTKAAHTSCPLAGNGTHVHWNAVNMSSGITSPQEVPCTLPLPSAPHMAECGAEEGRLAGWTSRRCRLPHGDGECGVALILAAGRLDRPIPLNLGTSLNRQLFGSSHSHPPLQSCCWLSSLASLLLSPFFSPPLLPSSLPRAHAEW